MKKVQGHFVGVISDRGPYR